MDAFTVGGIVHPIRSSEGYDKGFDEARGVPDWQLQEEYESEQRGGKRKHDETLDRSRLDTFVRSMGGIRSTSQFAGEVRRLSNRESGSTGLVTKSGLTPDMMREAAWDAGYIPGDWSAGDFLDAVEEAVRMKNPKRKAKAPAGTTGHQVSFWIDAPKIAGKTQPSFQEIFEQGERDMAEKKKTKKNADDRDMMNKALSLRWEARNLPKAKKAKMMKEARALEAAALKLQRKPGASRNPRVTCEVCGKFVGKSGKIEGIGGGGLAGLCAKHAPKKRKTAARNPTLGSLRKGARFTFKSGPDAGMVFTVAEKRGDRILIKAHTGMSIEPTQVVSASEQVARKATRKRKNLTIRAGGKLKIGNPAVRMKNPKKRKMAAKKTKKNGEKRVRRMLRGAVKSARGYAMGKEPAGAKAKIRRADAAQRKLAKVQRARAARKNLTIRAGGKLKIGNPKKAKTANGLRKFRRMEKLMTQRAKPSSSKRGQDIYPDYYKKTSADLRKRQRREAAKRKNLTLAAGGRTKITATGKGFSVKGGVRVKANPKGRRSLIGLPSRAPKGKGRKTLKKAKAVTQREFRARQKEMSALWKAQSGDRWPYRNPNYANLVIHGTATLDAKGWKVAGKHYKTGHGTAALGKSRYLDRATGQVYKKVAANPKRKGKPIRTVYGYVPAGTPVARFKRRTGASPPQTKGRAATAFDPKTKEGRIGLAFLHGWRGKPNPTSAKRIRGMARSYVREVERETGKKFTAAQVKAKEQGYIKAHRIWRANPGMKRVERLHAAAMKKHGTAGYAASRKRATDAQQKLKLKAGATRHHRLRPVRRRIVATLRARNAAGIFEKFHGRRATKTTTLNAADGTPARLDKLGKLVSIHAAKGTIKPSVTTWLCADSRGKLHLCTSAPRLIDGGPQDFGKVGKIEYETAKRHLGDKGPTIYYHRFGEEGGKRPTLYADGKGGLKFRGGSYTLKAEGIRD